MERLKEWSDTAENQEFKYPMWFKSKKWDYIVEFTDLRYGRVVKEGVNPRIFKTFTTTGWTAHTDTTTWEQVENPNLATDKEIEQVINEEYEKDAINPLHYKTGGIETIDFMKAKSTPEEFRGHLRLTSLKYLSRYGQKDNELQELKKAKWYLDRLIEELEK